MRNMTIAIAMTNIELSLANGQNNPFSDLTTVVTKFNTNVLLKMMARLIYNFFGFLITGVYWLKYLPIKYIIVAFMIPFPLSPVTSK